MKASQKSSQRSFIQHDYEVPRQLWAMEELYRELEIENPELRNNPYYVRLRRSFREFSDPHERTPRISISSSLLGSLKTNTGAPIRPIRMSPQRTKLDYIYRIVERYPRIFTDNLKDVFRPLTNPVRISATGIPYIEREGSAGPIRYYYFIGKSKPVRLWDEGILRLYPQMEYSYDPEQGTYTITGGPDGDIEVKPYSTATNGSIIPYHTNVPDKSNYTVNTASPENIWSKDKLKQIYYVQYGNTAGFLMQIREIPETVVPTRFRGKDQWETKPPEWTEAQPKTDEETNSVELADAIRKLANTIIGSVQASGRTVDRQDVEKALYSEFGKQVRSWLKSQGEKHSKSKARQVIQDLVSEVLNHDAR